MIENRTCNALICQRARDLLHMQGWPEHTDVVQLNPRWPSWLGICVRLDAADLMALLPRLCNQLERPDHRHDVCRAIEKLAGTKAEMVLYQSGHATPPTVPGDNTEINFPFALEWLTKEEIQTVLEVVTLSVRKVCQHMFDDAKRIQAALTPQQSPCLFARGTRRFRIVAEEGDEENWLDESDPNEVRRVLDAIINHGARYCAVRLVITDATLDYITGYSLMTDVLRFPGDPSRRWLDRDVLREVCTMTRQEIKSLMDSYSNFTKRG